MKPIILLFTSFLLWYTATAQNTCLPEGIVFRHQSDIDNFQINYPGCTKIEGDVVIYSYDDLYNLYGLSMLKSIGGYLQIGEPTWPTYNLRSVNGLEGLTYVAGGISIIYTKHLNNIEGLGNIDSIGSLMIRFNDSLRSLAGLEKISILEGGLWIEDNPSLQSINGLSGLTEITRNGFKFINNDSLVNLIGLENLEYCDGILQILGNKQLTDLNGLINLHTFYGGISINNNDALTSLEGIKNIQGYISYLNILSNMSLTYCHVQSVCNYIAHQIGPIAINDNGNGCSDYYEVKRNCESIGIDEIDLMEGLKIITDPSVSYIYIESTRPTKNYTISIFDVNGRQLVRQQYSGTSSIISTTSLNSGIYFIRIDGEKHVKVEKFINL
jgi:hypothetical protein